MFGIIAERQKEQQRNIENLLKAIVKAEEKGASLDVKLTSAINAGDMDTYSVLMTEKASLELFVDRTKAKINELGETPGYSVADLEEIKSNIIKNYNSKLEKAHKKIRKTLEESVALYEEYEKLSNEVTNHRIDLDGYARQIKDIVNLYEGVERLKNDKAKPYGHAVNMIKLALNNNIVE